MKYYSLIIVNEYNQIINIDFGKQVKNDSKSPEIKDIDNWTIKYNNYEELIKIYEQKYKTKIKEIKVYGTNLAGSSSLIFKDTIEKYGKITEENIYAKMKTMLQKDKTKRIEFINYISHFKEKKYTLDSMLEWLDLYFHNIKYKSLRDKYFEYIEWKEKTKELNNEKESDQLKKLYQDIKDGGIPNELSNIKIKKTTSRNETLPITSPSPNSSRQKLINKGIYVSEDEEDFDPDKYINEDTDNVVVENETEPKKGKENKTKKRTGKKK